MSAIPAAPDAARTARLIADRALAAVFQPIVDLGSGTVIAYEGLIRGPRGTDLETPAALFAQAARDGASIALEHAAAITCLDAFAALGCDGKLFLNFSAGAILALAREREHARMLLERAQIAAERIVIELTEQNASTDLAQVAPAVALLRDAGIQFALDDYGTANASMNLWLRLHPDVVKIDRFFIHDIALDPLKFEAVRAMQHFAHASGAKLIAEGIEHERDLIVVRDMGICCVQGFLLGRPHAQPERVIAPAARDAIRAPHIAVFPDASRAARPSGTVAAKMLVAAPALPRDVTSNDVLALFNRMPELHAVALVEHDRPVALVNRRSFMDRFALPYHREVFGRKPCLQFANDAPLMIENATTVEQLALLLANNDQRYLADGFVITEHGRYVGLGTGESLVRAVTEMRIEAARYANPLTFLPGNIPISAHIDRLLARDAGFHACYVDLNQFKPFNDQYGYWQGDEVLKYAATVLAGICDPQRDFLGHVGGDDFLVLFQSDDWHARAAAAIGRFNDGAQRFYTLVDQRAGGLHGEDRHGNPAFFGFVTMAIGAVGVPAGAHCAMRYGSDEIASVAALAKRRAKQQPDGLAVVDLDAGRAALLARGEPPATPH
ncbi:EAL domain-containing protein [Burkholderia ubonensis]|uniref:EAL domain-containing protein n=1 Tax=Burkholderia ubonensis TaxID=101571 RepID=UPI000F566582|nr:EAL domain-containing protein [Burkholderia ubonensis]RQP32429.1 GGDEF domain-containing protein [Burkholderia ubonensis]RQP46560.1 GGDEF domain-containing protein [Burkholderia ubonensis]RQP47717.1 GGDEF domain-containing protein [Burkholderia ubonensis]RQP58161.1 GGDEF domain-containing protein [Burkholderia ubonensis]RQP61791.1 GGDEF domain-containing protein [Burkholderia ubonensis]